MQFEFTAFPRGTEGRGASRRLRRTGRAPGIVYGGAEKPEPIELDHNALIHALNKEAFHSSILTMKLGEAAQRVLLRDVQMHPFRHEVLHIDFQRVDENRKIHMKVPLHFINAELAPAVKTTDAIISHVLTELDVSCLPKDLPAFVEVDLSPLAVGQSIHVSDLKLPAGVTAVTRPGASPVVATDLVPRIVVEVGEVGPRLLKRWRARQRRPGAARRQATERAAGSRGKKCRQGAAAKKDDRNKCLGTQEATGAGLGGPPSRRSRQHELTPWRIDSPHRGLGNPGREYRGATQLRFHLAGTLQAGLGRFQAWRKRLGARWRGPCASRFRRRS
jgi:large subunit ribosomal protein L25